MSIISTATHCLFRVARRTSRSSVSSMNRRLKRPVKGSLSDCPCSTSRNLRFASETLGPATEACRLNSSRLPFSDAFPSGPFGSWRSAYSTPSVSPCAANGTHTYPAVAAPSRAGSAPRTQHRRLGELSLVSAPNNHPDEDVFLCSAGFRIETGRFLVRAEFLLRNDPTRFIFS